MNVVFFGVKKSGISVFLVSVENGADVKKNDKYQVWAKQAQMARKLETNPIKIES